MISSSKRFGKKRIMRMIPRAVPPKKRRYVKIGATCLLASLALLGISTYQRQSTHRSLMDFEGKFTVNSKKHEDVECKVKVTSDGVKITPNNKEEEVLLDYVTKVPSKKRVGLSLRIYGMKGRHQRNVKFSYDMIKYGAPNPIQNLQEALQKISVPKQVPNTVAKSENQKRTAKEQTREPVECIQGQDPKFRLANLTQGVLILKALSKGLKGCEKNGSIRNPIPGLVGTSLTADGYIGGDLNDLVEKSPTLDKRDLKAILSGVPELIKKFSPKDYNDLEAYRKSIPSLANRSSWANKRNMQPALIKERLDFMLEGLYQICPETKLD